MKINGHDNDGLTCFHYTICAENTINININNEYNTINVLRILVKELLKNKNN